MFHFSKIKSELQLIIRGYKLLYTMDKSHIIYKTLKAVIGVISPYTTLYLSARLISGIAAGDDYGKLLLYAGFIIMINLIMSILKAFVQRKINVAERTIWNSVELYYVSVNLKMQYERLEDPKTHLKKERIQHAQHENGSGVMLLAWQIERFVDAFISIFLSVTLTFSLFKSNAYGKYHGIWKLINSPLAVLIVLAVICFNISVNIKITSKTLKVYNDEIRDSAVKNKLGAFYLKMLNHYESAAEIRIFNEAPLIQKSWFNYLIHPTCETNIIRSNARFSRIQSCVGFIMNLVLYIFIGAKAYTGAFGIGNFVLYTGTVSRFVSAFTSLSDIFAELKNNNIYLREIFEYIDIPNTMYQGTLPVEKRAYCVERDNEYEIEFRNVSFKYPASDTYALRNVSLSFRIGERLAVVGRNGSGKTTFIKLLCRLYDPTEGEILLNGIDIRKYNYEEYMSVFSVVFQDFTLFSFTLGQNVATSVDYDEARVSSCLVKAGFGERLQKMQYGLDTGLSKDFDENGEDISKGEAQKVALARALYKDAPFIILDEPTAALDPVAEYEVYAKFNEIVEDKTAIYISHRLSSCRFCDRIAVFDNGQIVQQGSHDELVAEINGTYYALWHAQAQYYNT